MSAQIALVIRMAIVIFVYVFLGLVIRTLWKYTFPSKSKPEKQIQNISFQNLNNEKLSTFTSAEVYIGRDPNAGFSVKDDAASNLHARIFQKDNGWWIEDLNSTNGTYLNDEILLAPTQLISEDVIRCGETEIQIAF